MKSIKDILTLPSKKNCSKNVKNEEVPHIYNKVKLNYINKFGKNNGGKCSKENTKMIDTNNPVEFPSLYEKKTQENKTIINFRYVINKGENMDQKKTLFSGDHLILSWYDVQKMYQSYAIFRIRLQYIILKRKISTLNLIEKEYPEKGKHFKDIFKYEDLVLEEEKMRICIMIWMLFEEFDLFGEKNILAKYLEKCRTSLENNVILEKNKNDDILKIKSLYSQCKNIIGLISKDFQKYIPFFRELLDFVNAILKETIVIENIFCLKNRLSTIHGMILDTMQQIIMENDPHIDCDYYVQLSAKRKTGPICNLGIGSSVFVLCNSPIDLTTKNKKINYESIDDITEEYLRDYFEKKKPSDDYYINLDMRNYKSSSSITPKSKCINIYYCIDEEIPKEKIFVKIIDLPKNIYVTASILYNYNLERKIDIAPIPGRNKMWLNNRSKELMNEEEYQSLDPQLKKYYKYNDTSKNIFIVDYLFNSLLKEDQNNKYIKPYMLESFRDLAIHTSYTNPI